MRYKKFWILATLATAGDVATTWYGLSALDFTEGNPLIAGGIAAIGLLPALVLSKLLVLLFGAGCVRIVDSHKWVIPASIAVIYTIVTALNSTAIALA